MTLYRPLSTKYITQRFGENLACQDIQTQKLLPGSYPGTCPAGSEKFYQGMGMLGHNGVDRPCWYKEPIYFSVLDSNCEWFARNEVDSAGGIGVDVVSRKPILKCTEPGCSEMHHIKVRNWHFERTNVYDNQAVKPGDIIGFGDSTGASSGHHLHIATKWCDENGDGLHTDNGYYGAFNDERFQRDIFIVDELNDRKREEIQLAENYGKWNQAEALKKELIQKQLSLLDLLRQLLLVLQQTALKGRQKLTTLWSQNHSA